MYLNETGDRKNIGYKCLNDEKNVVLIQNFYHLKKA